METKLSEYVSRVTMFLRVFSLAFRFSILASSCLLQQRFCLYIFTSSSCIGFFGWVAEIIVLIRTSEVWAVRKASGDLSVLRNDIDDALLYEVHLCSYGALFDDIISRLKDFIVQFTDDFGHEVRIGVREEGNGRDKSPTVVIDDLLRQRWWRNNCCTSTSFLVVTV